MTQRNRKAGFKHEDCFADMAKQSDRLVRHLDRFFTEFYGKRCRTYEPGCPCCDGWKMRDDMKKFIE